MTNRYFVDPITGEVVKNSSPSERFTHCTSKLYYNQYIDKKLPNPIFIEENGEYLRCVERERTKQEVFEDFVQLMRESAKEANRDLNQLS